MAKSNVEPTLEKILETNLAILQKLEEIELFMSKPKPELLDLSHCIIDQYNYPINCPYKPACVYQCVRISPEPIRIRT